MENAISNYSSLKYQALLWKSYKQLFECEVPNLAMEIAISNSSSAQYDVVTLTYIACFINF